MADEADRAEGNPREAEEILEEAEAEDSSVAKKPSAKNPPKSKAKAKAKTKASAKAKATAKAKGKGKSKGKVPTKGGGKTLKRPAAAGPQSSSKVPKKNEKDEQKDEDKKPKDTKEEKNKWKAGLIEEDKQQKEEGQEQGEEEQGGFEDDHEVNDFEVAQPEEDPSSTDRCKKQKFLKMLSSNQLPSFLVSEWRKSEGMTVGRRDAQRRIINACFDRSSSGKLLLSLEKPIFETMKKSYTDKSSTAAHKSLPRSLFQGKFGLSDQMFERGLEEGDFVQVKTASGATHYSWETSVHKVKVGDMQEQSVSTGVKGKLGEIGRAHV